MPTLRYRPGLDVTASPLTVLDDSAVIEAAQGGDQLAVERPLRRHQSLLDAHGSRFFLPGGDRDASPRRHASASCRPCASTAAAAARTSAVSPPCVTRQLSSALTAARRARHRQLTEAVPREAAERAWTALQCRENVVDLALAREQLRELSTS